MPDLTSLQRQRRFLILISIAVIAYYALGATPKTSAEYSGLGVTLNHPERIVLGVWLVWIWALWRYGQCLYEKWSEIRQELFEDVAAEDQRIAMARALSYAKQIVRQGEFAKEERQGLMVSSVQPIGTQQEDSALFNWTSSGARRYPMRMYLQWSTDGHPGGGSENYVMEIPKSAIRQLRTQAWLHGVFRLPAFSEFAAPLLIAGASVLSLLLAPNVDEEVDTRLIDSFWYVYSTTDLLSFDGEPAPLDISVLESSSAPDSSGS